MFAETLIQETVSRFPRFDERAIRIEPLEKGGSDRSYYRVHEPDGHSLILVKYGDSREENRHYCDIAQFLASLGIHVPEICFHDEPQRLIWMQDLGEKDLWSFRDEPWPRKRTLYEQALDELVALHTRGHHASAEKADALSLQAEFNAELYRWEQNYFFENCLGRFFGLESDAVDAVCPRDVLDEIAEKLAAQPRVLVHRDFQSQNILINGAHAWLIDFQGLRPGLAQYDLASLIHDPYMTLSTAEREELIGLYLEKSAAAGAAPREDFCEILDLCAMQRLMQALGAYGYLGLVKNRAHFLEHIPAALASLGEVTARIASLRPLLALLERLSPIAAKAAYSI
jgi:aminoglycoside/choline kinase family phosphotransferase